MRSLIAGLVLFGLVSSPALAFIEDAPPPERSFEGQVNQLITESDSRMESLSVFMDYLIMYFYDHDKISDLDAVYAAIYKAIQDQLGDPHTVYFPHQSFVAFSEQLQGKPLNYGGIGVGLAANPDGVEVLRTTSMGAAEAKGLKFGDVIIEANGHSLKGLGLYDAINLIGGPISTPVTIVVRHPDGTVQTYDMVRGPLYPDPVYGVVVNGYAHIWITEFSSGMTDEFAITVIEMKTAHPELKGIILDLRGNPGGYVSEALALLSILVPPHSLLITTEDNRGRNMEDMARSMPMKLQGVPLVVLVNGNSASASEIVSGALQDLGRAKIVGVQSYGKGSMQAPFDLPHGDGAKITTDHYYVGPNKVPVNGIGVTPNYVVQNGYEDLPLTEESYTLQVRTVWSSDPVMDAQLKKAIEVLDEQIGQ